MDLEIYEWMVICESVLFFVECDVECGLVIDVLVKYLYEVGLSIVFDFVSNVLFGE